MAYPVINPPPRAPIDFPTEANPKILNISPQKAYPRRTAPSRVINDLNTSVSVMILSPGVRTTPCAVPPR